jgi:hypothetical protein
MIRFIRSVIKFQLPRIRRVARPCAQVYVQALESTNSERHHLLPVLHGALRDPRRAVLWTHGLPLRHAGHQRLVSVHRFPLYLQLIATRTFTPSAT